MSEASNAVRLMFQVTKRLDPNDQVESRHR